MGADFSDHKTGYERLLEVFNDIQKQTPEGISLKRNRKTIIMRFELCDKREERGCNCSFTYDGISEALQKARKVAIKLKEVSTTSEFDEWYTLEILEFGKVEDDSLTFGEAIAKVEEEFWSGYRRSKKEKEKRDRNNPSDIESYKDTYGRFYEHLPQNKKISLEPFKEVLKKWKQGTKTYKGCVSALKKLARAAKKAKILEYLGELNVTQTEFRKLQEIELEEFLAWRDRVLGISTVLHKNTHLDVRKRWMWVFSVQLVYGLRISEVFAILNLKDNFITTDRHTIPAICDPNNKDNILVIGSFTQLNTTTKTGYRLARPMIPPSHPDLIDRLNIKDGDFPRNKPKKGSSPRRIRSFYNLTARDYMVRWGAPITQTHASRGLANILGMQAGISQEVRSQSLGHTVEQNDSAYKKRQKTKTTLDLLLNSEKQAIDFVSAVNAVKSLLKSYPDSKEAILTLLCLIYQKEKTKIDNLF